MIKPLNFAENSKHISLGSKLFEASVVLEYSTHNLCVECTGFLGKDKNSEFCLRRNVCRVYKVLSMFDGKNFHLI